MKIYSKKSLILRLILSALIIVVGVLGFVFQEKIEQTINGVTEKVVEEADFKMYVIDVGQGDSIFLQFSDNKNMLVDCGKKSAGDNVVNFLKEKNITTINYLVYTHTDEDHIGGGKSVFDNFDVEILYRPKVLSLTENDTFGNPNGYEVKTKNGNTYDNSIMAAYDEYGCLIKYSAESEPDIVGTDYRIKFLNPDQDNYNLNTKSNTYSVVLMIEVNSKKVLLTGDAEDDVEERLIDDYSDYLDADILKVSHHGSKTATTTNFLKKVTPDYALISVGKNQWSMPHEEVLERLNTANVKNVLTTQNGGTITVGINDAGQIGVSQNGKGFKLDLPIFASVLGVLLLLTWGIVVIKKDSKSSKGKKKSKKG